MSAQRLRLLFCDHLNLARGKYMPGSKIGDGASRFSQSTFALDYAKNLIPAPGSRMLEGLGDMEAVYSADGVRAGWEPDTKVVVADLQESSGVPLPMCGRSLLKRTVQQWQALGYNPKAGLELEAYAYQRAADGRWVPYDTPGAYVYGTGPLCDPLRFTDAVWQQAERSGFKLECLTTEFDSPQFEFTLTYDDALKAVDDIFLFRLMVREVALAHGVWLTFMPKPIPSKGGSGLHVNFSFADRQGVNALGATDDPTKLSPLTRGCIAGLMQHHAGMAALVAPTANSYERLRPVSMSGYWRNWGIDHRGVTTRLSTQQGARARIEHRMGDGAANPYVLVATVLQAARLGFTQHYPLAAPEAGDCFDHTDASEGVGPTLAAALDALEADTALVDAVGKTLVSNHVAIKRAEVAATATLEGEALRDYYFPYL